MHRQHGQTVHCGNVINTRERLLLDKRTHGIHDLIRVLLAVLYQLPTELYSARQHERRLALLCAQIGIARGLRQTVRLTDDRAADDLNAHGQVEHHTADDRQLLCVLLTEERLIRRYDVEQLGNDRAHAAEMNRTGLAAQLARHFGLHLNKGGKAVRIHLGHLGMEHHVTAALGQQRTVVLEITRIGLQILTRTELGRIEEHGRYRAVALLHGRFDQTGVSFMQIAHGRHQTDGQTLLFPLAHLCAYFCDGCCDFHCICSCFSQNSASSLARYSSLQSDLTKLCFSVGNVPFCTSFM